jgi:hypothetical protein
MLNYKREFRYFDFEIPTLPEGFIDVSWHNNVCPTFERNLNDVEVITFGVDYKNPKRRERGGKQFFILSEPDIYQSNDFKFIFETNSWDVAIRRLNKIFKEKS